MASATRSVQDVKAATLHLLNTAEAAAFQTSMSSQLFLFFLVVRNFTEATGTIRKIAPAARFDAVPESDRLAGDDRSPVQALMIRLKDRL